MLNSISMPSLFGFFFNQTKTQTIKKKYKPKHHQRGTFYTSSKSIFRANEKNQGKIESLRLHPDAIAIYNLLQSYNYGDNIVYPSFPTMREQVEISNENLNHTLFFLQDAGLITITTEKNRNGGRDKFIYHLKPLSDKDITAIKQKLPEAKQKLKDRKKERSNKKGANFKKLKKKTNFTHRELVVSDNKNTFSPGERDNFSPGEKNNNSGDKTDSINCYSIPENENIHTVQDCKNEIYEPVLAESILSQPKFEQDNSLDTGLIRLCIEHKTFRREFDEFCEEDSFSYREDRLYWIMRHASLHKLSVDDVVESLQKTNNKVGLGQIKKSPITYLIGVFERKSKNKQAGIQAVGKRKVYQISEYIKTRLGDHISYFKDYNVDLNENVLQFIVRNPKEETTLADWCTIIAQDINKRFNVNLVSAISA